MGLGQHLVRELGLVESTDTLARWLAHEVAEAITRVQVSKTKTYRAKARRDAIELISKLWEHRAQLPGAAYPLAKLRDILRTLSLFTEDSKRAWWGYNRDDQSEAAVFHAFSRLMPCLLLMGDPYAAEGPEKGSAAYDHLDRDEQAILDSLRVWLDCRLPVAEPASSRAKHAKRGRSVGRTKSVRSKSKDRAAINAREVEERIRQTALAAISALENGLVSIRARIAEGPAANRE